MAVVYAKETVGVGQDDGNVIMLRRGQAWDAGAPVVLANPNLFEGEPAKIQGRRVERATAAPGEKRGPGRPRKTAE